LFNNSKIWHLASLKTESIPLLMSAPANAIKVAQHYPDSPISFVGLRKKSKPATPKMYSSNKLALLL
jgi:hypothetical protein